MSLAIDVVVDDLWLIARRKDIPKQQRESIRALVEWFNDSALVDGQQTRPFQFYVDDLAKRA